MRTAVKHIVRLVLVLLLLAPFGVLHAQKEQTDVPRRGEGITSFLQRHGRDPRLYYADFLELNRKKLRGREELRMGVRYVIPPLKKDKKPSEPDKGKTTPSKSKTAPRGKTVREPLLGARHADVQVTSNRLAGACFYLSSGHGGPDPGAIAHVGSHELHEDEYAYDITLRLARQLLSEGAEVRIIIQDAQDGIRDDAYLPNSKRETCMGEPIPLGPAARLEQRSSKINALYRKDRNRYKYCRSVFIHVDSRGRGEKMDVYFYHAPSSRSGRRLANTLRTTFKNKYATHQPGRGFTGTVSGRDLYVLQHTDPVGVFVELGNIQNQSDLRRLIISENREALAKWLKDGIVKDFQSN